MELSEDVALNLICEIKKPGRECLYDLSNSSYKNNHIKQNIWSEVAEAVGISRNECQKHWKSLRRPHKTAINKSKGKSGSERLEIKGFSKLLMTEMDYFLNFNEDKERRSAKLYRNKTLLANKNCRTMSLSSNFECRTCFDATNGGNSLHATTLDHKNQLKSYAELLLEVTEINTQDDNRFEEMPQIICGNCSQRLESAYAFIHQAKEVNEKLYAMLNENKESLLKEIKIENNEEEQLEKESLECLQETPIDIGLEAKNEIDDELEQPASEVKQENKSILCNANTLDSYVGTTSDNDDDVDEIDDDVEGNYDSHSESLLQADDREYQNKSKKKKSSKTEDEDLDIAMPCPECNNTRIYKNAKALAIHQKICHMPEENKVSCPLCDCKYKRSCTLYEHMRTHHGPETIDLVKKPKPERECTYACDKCSKKYGKKGHLTHHKKIKHSSEAVSPPPPTQIKVTTGKRNDPGSLCPICGSFFTTRNHLTGHLRSHMGERPFKCDWCERSFLVVAQLNRHKRQHTGDKPHKCQICGKCFASGKDVRQHLVTHSDERPYKCSQCDRSYKSSWDLKKHKIIHTGERPFVCTVCGDNFNRLSSLRAHQKIHERKATV